MKEDTVGEDMPSPMDNEGAASVDAILREVQTRQIDALQDSVMKVTSLITRKPARALRALAHLVNLGDGILKIAGAGFEEEGEDDGQFMNGMGTGTLIAGHHLPNRRRPSVLAQLQNMMGTPNVEEGVFGAIAGITRRAEAEELNSLLLIQKKLPDPSLVQPRIDALVQRIGGAAHVVPDDAADTAPEVAE